MVFLGLCLPEAFLELFDIGHPLLDVLLLRLLLPLFLDFGEQLIILLGNFKHVFLRHCREIRLRVVK